MSPRETIHELATLLGDACALAAEHDPVNAAAIMRAANTALDRFEDAEERDAERGRARIRETRSAYLRLKRRAELTEAPERIEAAHVMREIIVERDAQAALDEQIAAATGSAS